MSVASLSRKHKAMTIVPLAIASGLWTASIVGFGAANASGTLKGPGGKLPDGTSVPSQAVQAPASIPSAGVIAPGVPAGTADMVVNSSSASGIPSAALSAYQRAAQVIDSADKSCHIPWELIAAIGRVESDHGRYGGNVLTSEGVSRPGIYGLPLDGKNGTQAVMDTDGGQLDHDTVYDRAVGAMQFIPGTWAVVKVDADGDGQRNPQDIDDSSLATAVYLCSGSENLGARPGQESAVFRYNHSQAYVNLVLRIMEAYQTGDYSAVPTSAYGGSIYSSSPTAQMASARKAALKKIKLREMRMRRQHQQSSSGSSYGGSSTVTSTSSGSGGSITPSAPSGGGSDPVSQSTDTATNTVKSGTDTVKKTASDTGGTVTNTLTASQKCLQQIGLSTDTALSTLSPSQLLAYQSCMG